MGKRCRIGASRASLWAGLVAVAWSAAGCSDASDGTAGRRIVLATEITAGAEATEPFDNAMGWSIALDTLVVSTGPLYYFDGATIFSQNDAPSNPTYQFLERSIGVKSAHAHPGHYVPGTARGQVLVGTAVDLRAGPAYLAVGEGVTGLVRSATFSFGVPAAGPLAEVLGSHVVVMEGTASRGDDVRAFRVEIDADDMLNTKKQPVIEGCPFEKTEMVADGTVTVAIQLRRWFDRVEFDAVPASAGGRSVVIPASSIAHNEIVRGLKVGDAYVFSYSMK